MCVITFNYLINYNFITSPYFIHNVVIYYWSTVASNITLYNARNLDLKLYCKIFCKCITKNKTLNKKKPLARKFSGNAGIPQCFVQLDSYIVWSGRYIPQQLVAEFAARRRPCCVCGYSVLHHDAECTPKMVPPPRLKLEPYAYAGHEYNQVLIMPSIMFRQIFFNVLLTAALCYIDVQYFEGKYRYSKHTICSERSHINHSLNYQSMSHCSVRIHNHGHTSS